MKSTIYVIGGDLRQITVADLLKKEGFDVYSVGLSENNFDLCCLRNADYIVLPIPVSYDNVYINAPLSKMRISVSEVLDSISENCFVFGACISDEISSELVHRKIAFADYYKREELIIKNAIPTAEGAIEIALSEMPVTLFESRVLITGYGRVGKVLAERMAALGADVTVSARKCSDFAWINERGFRAIHTNELIESVDKFDLIVNTIPAVVLTEEVLEKVSGDTLVIDLASKPGGVDFNTAKRLGKNVIWALSIPGKSAPITSGRIIKETIMNILAETGV
ncbi:MAG: dipicolinate synthase subunit DpsA [Clostridiales bacterium]|nr:dipicolinate synthase subunit DpsA [Clostridiales bacterium]